MSEEAQNPQASQGQLRIERLYLKDCSFESPGAPTIFSEQFQPRNQLDINTSVNSLGDERHEVVLSVTVTTRRDEERVAFIAEVHYAGIFVIEGLNKAQLRQVLGVVCPGTLFPYVRETLDGLAVKGGFGPLNIAPINFDMVYQQAMQKRAEQAGADSADGPIQH